MLIFKSFSNFWEKLGFRQKSRQNWDNFDFVPNLGHVPKFVTF